MGDGQHGTARFSTKQEIKSIYKHIPFQPELWRQGGNLPTVSEQSIILGSTGAKNKVTALADTDDVHCLKIGASGVGKMAFFLYPNLEYACASGENYGQNQVFNDAAEGLLSSIILLIAEYLPPDHKARWFAGAAPNPAEQAMASVLSTVLSRLNAFLDSEMEQILCFETAIDAEKFCNEKFALFAVLPEEDLTKYFMVSLMIQQLYREILAVADENGGKLKNRVMFYCD